VVSSHSSTSEQSRGSHSGAKDARSNQRRAKTEQDQPKLVGGRQIEVVAGQIGARPSQIGAGAAETEQPADRGIGRPDRSTGQPYLSGSGRNGTSATQIKSSDDRIGKRTARSRVTTDESGQGGPNQDDFGM
jgi:hypothetical protein